MQCAHDFGEGDSETCVNRFLDIRPPGTSCQTVFHVQCAKKAEYFMKHNSLTNSFEVFCHSHKPLLLKQEEAQSLWDRIDNITNFIQTVQDIFRKQPELIKHHASLAQSLDTYQVGDKSVWPESVRKQVFEWVRDKYLRLERVREVSQQQHLGFWDARDVDYRYCLRMENLPWQELSDFLRGSVSQAHLRGFYTAERLYRFYYSQVGMSEFQFKTKVITRKDLGRYAKVESAIAKGKLMVLNPQTVTKIKKTFAPGSD